MALKKRKEHNLEAWVLFIDLIKAFDTVPHAASGPSYADAESHRGSLVASARFTDVKVTLPVGDASTCFGYTIGVKQGDSSPLEDTEVPKCISGRGCAQSKIIGKSAL